MTKNIGLKLVSLLIAFVIWMAVVNVSNPEITGSRVVQVEVRNEKVITNVGKTYEFTDPLSVTVSYVVRTRDEYRVKASDFRAYVDLKDLYDVTSSVPIQVEVVDNKDLYIGTPVAKQNVLHVSIEDLVKETYVIEAETTGTPQEGYSVGSININPTSVTVTGPRSVVDRIAGARIDVDLSGVGEDTGGVANVQFVDGRGAPADISDSRLSFSRQSVEYYITTLSGRTVPVTYEVKGSPAYGCRYDGLEASVNEITVMGTKEALNDVNRIVIPAGVLDISGASSNKVFTLNLADYAPANVQLVGNTDVSVTVYIQAQSTKTFSISLIDMQLDGSKPGYVYALEQPVSVTVRGMHDDLERLDVAGLGAVLHLASIETEGSYEGLLTFQLDPSYALDSYTPFTVVVTKGSSSGPATDSSAERKHTAEEHQKNPETEFAEPEESSSAEEISDEEETTAETPAETTDSNEEST